MNPSASPDRTRVARRFACALDRSDYAAARQFLSADCMYVCRGNVHVGADVVLGAYRETDDWAKHQLDEIAYESEVEALADGRFRIAFVDHLRQGEACHTFHCQQVLRFDRDGCVEHIEHVDLPGEKEALDVFLAACGLSRPGDRGD